MLEHSHGKESVRATCRTIVVALEGESGMHDQVSLWWKGPLSGELHLTTQPSQGVTTREAGAGFCSERQY